MQQNAVGLKILEKKLDEISSPRSMNYQKWLSFEEVGSLTSNPEGRDAVLKWLAETRSPRGELAVVTWQSRRGEYIKARASIEHWEHVLRTEFFEYHDQQPRFKVYMNSTLLFFRYYNTMWLRQNSKSMIHRAKHYSVPSQLREHLYTIFNTVQMPPEVFEVHTSKSSTKIFEDTVANFLRGGDLVPGLKKYIHPDSSTIQPADNVFTQPVTVKFLNGIYNIKSNKGSSALYQTVFATGSQYYSPSDLAAFQSKNGIPQQLAQNDGGHVATQPVRHALSTPLLFLIPSLAFVV